MYGRVPESKQAEDQTARKYSVSTSRKYTSELDKRKKENDTCEQVISLIKVTDMRLRDPLAANQRRAPRCDSDPVE